jgi:antitoxin HigA-1
MRMYSPPHPGEIVREECLEPLGLTVTEAATGLGVSRKALSELLNVDFPASGAQLAR